MVCKQSYTCFRFSSIICWIKIFWQINHVTATDNASENTKKWKITKMLRYGFLAGNPWNVGACHSDSHKGGSGTKKSSYRANHSTETALLHIVNELLLAFDSGKISLLTLLDLPGVFDTIDHSILLSHLEHTFGTQNTALSWFRSYLSDRFQTVSVYDTKSWPVKLACGVPQGSVEFHKEQWHSWKLPFFSENHIWLLYQHSELDDPN